MIVAKQSIMVAAYNWGRERGRERRRREGERSGGGREMAKRLELHLPLKELTK